ncbi:MAG TPA: class I SAM-dependent methyltransferase [Bryobacteraceae bacterium]|jgi:2-polyprenyl-3-methyl-5-hydroxy-6-metoxy-1,4-benzoquinol methylase
MDPHTYWETIYRTKAPDSVSWYRPHLEVSLALIERAAPTRSAAVIDVGGGESTLVDDLVQRGFQNVTVLDISPTALEVARKRLGQAAAQVHWIPADVTRVSLPAHCFDVWHDRAVFHFLTTAEDRTAYVRNVLHAMRPGGFVIVSTFGPEGPARCSGLEVVRYGAGELHGEFGAAFRLVESATEQHSTPWGAVQQFVYCYCRVEREANSRS